MVVGTASHSVINGMHRLAAGRVVALLVTCGLVLTLDRSAAAHAVAASQVGESKPSADSTGKGWSSVTQDKGQAAELAALARMIREGAPEGFIAEQIEVSRMTLESERRLMQRATPDG